MVSGCISYVQLHRKCSYFLYNVFPHVISPSNHAIWDPPPFNKPFLYTDPCNILKLSPRHQFWCLILIMQTVSFSSRWNSLWGSFTSLGCSIMATKMGCLWDLVTAWCQTPTTDMTEMPSKSAIGLPNKLSPTLPEDMPNCCRISTHIAWPGVTFI